MVRLNHIKRPISISRIAVLASVIGLCVTFACRDSGPGGGSMTIIPEDSDPAWSADGQWLAFTHQDSLNLGSLYVARVDGSERRLVAAGGWGADWSPDGSRLLLGVGSTYQLYMLELATGAQTRLTDSGVFNVPGALSPDGQVIAFTSDGVYGGGGPGLWLMQADGSQPRRVPGGGGDHDWAPAGDKIVFCGAELTIMDTSGANVVALTAAFRPNQPAWSPTNEWIAYVRLLDGNRDIRVIRPDGSGDRLLFRGGLDPAWSPDGQHVAFSRFTGDETAIWSVDVNGQNLRRLSWPRTPTP